MGLQIVDRRDAGPIATFGAALTRFRQAGTAYPDHASAAATFSRAGSHGARRNQVRFRYLVEALGPDEVLRELETRVGYTLERWEEAPPPPGRTESFIG
jgi:sulfite reductase beta subunit-like hemoprotein